jgi:hypothetical protein
LKQFVTDVYRRDKGGVFEREPFPYGAAKDLYAPRAVFPGKGRKQLLAGIQSRPAPVNAAKT